MPAVLMIVPAHQGNSVQALEIDNKTKWAFTKSEPIGVCGQMYVECSSIAYAMTLKPQLAVSHGTTPL